MVSINNTKQELYDEVVRIQAELKTATDVKDQWYKSYADRNAELESLHDIVDSIDGVLERDKKDGYSKNSITARVFSAFMIIKK